MDIKKRKNSFWVAVFLFPSLIGFMLFYIIPFTYGIYYSIIDGPITKKFVWLDNYFDLFKNPVFLNAITNTCIFTALSVPLIISFSLIIAMLLNAKLYYRSVLRSFYIVPLVIPVVSVVLLWEIIFDIRGVFNAVLTLIINVDAIDWLNSKLARGVVIILYIWKNTGYNMVLFLVGLQNIPVGYYELADMEGARWWWKLKNITLLYLIPTAFFVFIISIINSFKVFRETYIIAGAYPHKSIYMLQHFMNNVFSTLDYQKLTSAACIMFIIVIIIVLLLFKIERIISNKINQI